MPPVILKNATTRNEFAIVELDGIYLCDTPRFFRVWSREDGRAEKTREFVEWFKTTYEDQAWIMGDRDIYFTSYEQAFLYKLRWQGA